MGVKTVDELHLRTTGTSTTLSKKHSQDHHSAWSTANSLLPTHSSKKRDNNVHVDLNWNTELEDTATSNRIVQKWRVKLVQELHPRNLHRDPKQLRKLTVVCTVMTRHQSLNNNGSHQLDQQLQLWDLDGLLSGNLVGITFPKHNREVQHFVDELNPGTVQGE